MQKIKSYIITQNKEYFLKNSEYIKIKNSYIKKIIKSSNIVNAFLYDNEKNKLYGHYEIDFNDLNNLNDNKINKKNEEFFNIKIADNYKRRRGIYYKLDKKYLDFSLYEIDEKIFLKLKNGLSLLNENISQTFFSCSIEKDLKDNNENNDIFKYKAIETYPSLYIAEYEKKFDYQAYKSVYKEYQRLLKTSNSENDNSDKYIEIGSCLMNMLIPEKEFRKHLLDGFRIVYLHLDENTCNIPWEILASDGKFISENIIFSYTNAVNILFNNGKKNNVGKMAVISIPNDDIKNDKREIEILNSFKDIANIDLYRKEHNYFDFIKVLENYDIVHIITHGYSNGIKLSEDYILNSVNALENPPSLVFINACNLEENNNKLIQSMLSAGVNTVISGTGSLADGIYMDFIKSFYSNLFHKHTRINTAQAYYFAHTEIKESYNGFIRYRFNGVPVYV